jgi:hypothetical protein
MFCKFCGREIPEKLTSASFCPFCGRTLTEVEHPTLEIISAGEQQSQTDFIAVAANEKSARMKQTLAILGASLLFVGVFLPIVSLPIIGSLNYFHNGQGDGTIILVLAVVSVILAATRRFRGLLVTGLCSVGLLLFTLANFMIRMSELRGQMQEQLAGNPFRGLADLAMNSIQLQWGWAVLMLGGVLIVAAAAVHGPASVVPQQVRSAGSTAKWIGATIAIFLALVWLASLFNTQQSEEKNSTVENTISAPSTTATSQTPEAENVPPGYPYFSDGTHIVGQDVSPGIYRTRAGSPGCYYARLAGFSGDLGDIISNENTEAPVVVAISSTDKGFVSRGCGVWTEDLSAITSSGTTFGDGIYIVGTDIQPGTYRNNSQQSCYYARLRGFGGVLGDIISNENTNSPAVVTIFQTDKGFKSSQCGIWTLLSGAQSSPQNENSSFPSYQSPNPATEVSQPRGSSETPAGESQNSFSSYTAQLRSAVVSRRYQPIGNTWLVAADADGNKLLIQQATCNSVPDGHCQKLFIAFNDRFLGTDTLMPSWAIHNIAQEGVGSFSALYEDISDPNRKPPPVKVVYTWNGQTLTAAGTPPTRKGIP